MKILGAALAAVLIAFAYLTWGLSWPAVIAAGIVGILLSQVMHATGGREVFTTAGTICLFVAFIGALILVVRFLMG